ncbi:Unannotated [Lentimonas sp. CC4]|nr:Unannotated [Lentimonas sp. CC4]CAA6686343.1 Unannotated [Lentimonas sp. CC6]CAA7076118.1 Unannotated [Lentimonas sp. CC4]CAA7170889.1 Unannotated [Lentimonas sp. CC21]CAA7181169.1 Unannotated [Lentimonas sp. CC8]
MGCGGCELFSGPAKILKEVDQVIKKRNAMWTQGRAKKTYQGLIDTAYGQIDAPGEGHLQEVTTTNIHHFKSEFLDFVTLQCDKDTANAAKTAIESHITCYAAMLHLNKASSLLPAKKAGSSLARQAHKGYAPTFEQVKPFPGRVEAMASERDLLGTRDPHFIASGKRTKPGRGWIDGLPRLIFVSDMGDAFSDEKDFDFLKTDTLPAIRSEAGKRHLWLWLTKRPQKMKKFASQIGGLPENVCAMSTLTQADSGNLNRLKALTKVPAKVRGLSIEPLWDRIPPEKLPLEGIDWVIVGGESGTGESLRPFNVEWARELREHCRESGVAFFMKQMGRRPVDGAGNPILLKDSHGGDWDEWEAAGLADLKIREFPKYFHEYRSNEKPRKSLPTRRGARQPVVVNQLATSESLSDEERREFRRLDQMVAKAAKAFVDAGIALARIKEGKLYRQRFKTFEEYCADVHNISRSYAYHLAKAGTIVREMSTIVDISRESLDLLKCEAHVRELARLPDVESRGEVLEIVAEGNEVTAARIREAVEAKLEATPKPSRSPSPSVRIQNAKRLLDELEDFLNSGNSAKQRLPALVQKLRDALVG